MKFKLNEVSLQLLSLFTKKVIVKKLTNLKITLIRYPVGTMYNTKSTIIYQISEL